MRAETGTGIALDDGYVLGKFGAQRTILKGRNPPLEQEWIWMTDNTPTPGDDAILTLGRLGRSGPHRFALQPDSDARQAAAMALAISDIRKLRFEGALDPTGKSDWSLSARLGATVVQPCVVSLIPVTTRIDIDVTRHYRADYMEPDADEAEIPEDDTLEALPTRLDLRVLMLEALALALPDYPRADGATLEIRQFAAPGVAPMTDEDAKPLSGLARLRDATTGATDDDDGQNAHAQDDDGAGAVRDSKDGGD